MCLNRLSKEKFKIPREGNHQVGWKVFKEKRFYPRFEQNLFPLYFGSGSKIPENIWIKEKDFRGFEKIENIYLGNSNRTYPLGFHIFLNRKDAIRYKGFTLGCKEVVRKVYFRKVIAHGYQDYKIIVAKEMFVHSDKDI